MIKIMFAGTIRKVNVKNIGTDQILEFSLCKKNHTKPGAEATFTWLAISVYKPPQWLLDKAHNDAFCSGVGDFTLRSYEKDGTKRQSAEVRCDSFSIDIADSSAPVPVPVPAPARTQAPVTATSDSATDEPPF